MQHFRGRVEPGAGGRGVIALPFDPDEAWGARAEHRVSGTVNGMAVRATIARAADGWAFTVTPLLMRGTGIAVDTEVTVELAPEGPQRADLAEDIAAALDADPAAAAFFDTLAQFYRKAYLTWIDGAARRPEVRAARIAEMVDLLASGTKERPRRQAASRAEESHP